MAHLSKLTLPIEQQDYLSRQLSEVIGKMNSLLALDFLSEFLGPEEKIMLTKRLAIIALIHEGRPLHRIAVHLHVSESTVSKLYTKYKSEAFNSTIKALTINKIDYQQYIKILDALITVGGIMPHRTYTMKPKKDNF